VKFRVKFVPLLTTHLKPSLYVVLASSSDDYLTMTSLVAMVLGAVLFLAVNNPLYSTFYLPWFQAMLIFSVNRFILHIGRLNLPPRALD